MAPKSKGKPKGKAKTDASNEGAEEPLYAIVIADSYETRMSPLNLDGPRCLMPLANTPLIEYTLTWLFQSQIDRVHIYCGAHRKQVEEYLK
jgi:translation initiation factor eIF-2B subunit epsilon